MTGKIAAEYELIDGVQGPTYTGLMGKGTETMLRAVHQLHNSLAKVLSQHPAIPAVAAA